MATAVPRLPAQALNMASVHICIDLPLPRNPVLVLGCPALSEIKIILIEIQMQHSDSGNRCS